MSTKTMIDFAVATKIITPTIPCGLAGYFTLRMWEKIHDDLEVRVIIFRDKTKLSAIVQYDLLSSNREVIDLVCSEVEGLGLNKQNIIFTATHTHTAPVLTSDRLGFNGEYIPFVAAKTIEAIREAFENFQTGEVFCTQTSDIRFLFNRRYWMKDGKVLTNPGKLNKEILRPEGEIDPEIPIFAIKVNNKIEVVLANIVNHSDTIGGFEVSADWPGVTKNKLKKELNCQFVMPLIGCAGNINHFDTSHSLNQNSFAEATRIGEGIADTILNALENLKADTNCQMEIKSSTIKLLPREPFPEEITEAREILEKYKDLDTKEIGSGELNSEDLVKGVPIVLKFFAEKLMEVLENAKAENFCYTQIEIGNSIFCSLPGEPFCEIGLYLRKNVFDQKNAFVLELGDGIITYIPNSYNYRRGGYETMIRSNRLSRYTDLTLINAIKELNM